MNRIKKYIENVINLRNVPICFQLNPIDIDKISANFYNPHTLKILDSASKFPNLVTLEEISNKVKYSDGKWELRQYDYVPEEFPNRVLLLQILNLEEGELKIGTKYDKYISSEKHEKWKNSQVEKGNIIIAITGTIGLSALVPDNFPKANLNQALAIVELKDEVNVNGKKIKINPKFVTFYLNSIYGRTYFEWLGGFRAGQSGLSTDEIKSIKIPLLENQDSIVKKIEEYRRDAFEYLKKYRSLIRKLRSIYYDFIDAKVPSETKDLTYILENPKGVDRIDALYHSPFLKKLVDNIKEKDYKKLSELAKIQKGGSVQFKDSYRLIDLDDIDENIGEVVNIKEVTDLGSEKIVLRKDEVLVSKLQPEKGKIILVNENIDSCVGSSELIPLKVINNEITPKYLWAILRSPYVLKQWEYQITGSTRMRIGKKELKDTLIPIIEKKDELTEKIDKLTREAKDMKFKYVNSLKVSKDLYVRLLNENLKN